MILATIASGVSEEEVLNSFEDINLQEETPDAPKNDEKVEDLLGKPSGKFDYKVFYSKPPSYNISIESIMPGGQGNEFEDNEPKNEEEKKVKDAEQSQKEIEDKIMPSGGFELLDRKETCMVEVWKNGKKDSTIEVIDIWYNSDEENTKGYNVWSNNSKVSQVTRSGKGYKPVEKKVERAVKMKKQLEKKIQMNQKMI